VIPAGWRFPGAAFYVEGHAKDLNWKRYSSLER